MSRRNGPGADRRLLLALAASAAVASVALLWPRDGAAVPVAATAASCANDREAAAVDASDVALARPQAEPRDDRIALAVDPRDWGPSAPRSPRATEQAHYRAFVALAARDPAALERCALDVIAADVPDCRRVALLRALGDTACPARTTAFVRAIRELPAQGASGTESVPSFAIGWLAAHAAGDPTARATLAELAFAAAALPLDLGLRRRAAAAFAGAADANELADLPAHLAREPDAQLRAGVLAALGDNPARAAAASARRRLGSDDTGDVARDDGQ